MAITTQKISQLTLLTNETTGIKDDRIYLSGSEYLMVSYNGKSYKVPTSVVLGTIIKSVEQELAEGDEAISNINITTDDGTVMNFHVQNGSRGQQGVRGITGADGKQGDHGLIVNTDDIESIITNNLDSTDSTKVLSAAAAAELAKKISDLGEVYLNHQESYDTLAGENNIDDNLKYYVFDEDDVTEDDIDDLTAIKAATIAK